MTILTLPHDTPISTQRVKLVTVVVTRFRYIVARRCLELDVERLIEAGNQAIEVIAKWRNVKPGA